MTSETIREWRPDQELTRLLDAGAAELLAASDQELAEQFHDAGARGRNVVEAVRRLAKAAANADFDAPPAVNFVTPWRRIHLAGDN